MPGAATIAPAIVRRRVSLGGAVIPLRSAAIGGVPAARRAEDQADSTVTATATASAASSAGQRTTTVAEPVWSSSNRTAGTANP